MAKTKNQPQQILTQSQVLSELNRRYRSNVPQGITDVFNKLRNEYNNYRNTNDIDTLRYLLALCLRTHHGCHMEWADTRKAVDILIQNNILNCTFKDFEDLHKTLKSWFKDVHFARGPLTLYDTALNIGHLLLPPVEPVVYVYLYSGAWEGAVFLNKHQNLKHIMPVSDWHTPDLFPNLDSKTIEAILCVYKEIFEKLANGNPVTQADLDAVDNPCCPRPPRRFPSKNEVLKKMGYV